MSQRTRLFDRTDDVDEPWMRFAVDHHRQIASENAGFDDGIPKQLPEASQFFFWQRDSASATNNVLQNHLVRDSLPELTDRGD